MRIDTVRLWDSADKAIRNRGDKAVWVSVDAQTQRATFATGDVDDLPWLDFYEVSERAALEGYNV